jgi:hypothetical protein
VYEAVYVEKGAHSPPLPAAVVCPPGGRRRRRLALARITARDEEKKNEASVPCLYLKFDPGDAVVKWVRRTIFFFELETFLLLLVV